MKKEESKEMKKMNERKIKSRHKIKRTSLSAIATSAILGLSTLNGCNFRQTAENIQKPGYDLSYDHVREERLEEAVNSVYRMSTRVVYGSLLSRGELLIENRKSTLMHIFTEKGEAYFLSSKNMVNVPKYQDIEGKRISLLKKEFAATFGEKQVTLEEAALDEKYEIALLKCPVQEGMKPFNLFAKREMVHPGAVAYGVGFSLARNDKNTVFDVGKNVRKGIVASKDARINTRMNGYGIRKRLEKFSYFVISQMQRGELGSPYFVLEKGKPIALGICTDKLLLRDYGTECLIVGSHQIRQFLKKNGFERFYNE